MMKAIRLALVAITLAAAVAPLTATASHCGSNVIIFSTNDVLRSNLESMGLPSALNSSAVTCPALDHDADSRLINPGSDAVRVRYASTCSLGDAETPPQTIGGHISGLGLDEDITLTCDVDPLLGGNTRYQSGWLTIDPTLQGCITASIPSAAETNSFHTVAQPSC